MTTKTVLPSVVGLLLMLGTAMAAPHPEAGEPTGERQTAVSLPADRPLISIALALRQELGLSEEQVRRLRALRSQFQKEAIRRQAERRLQEVELRAEGRLSRIRTLEQGKALLSNAQQKKLASLLERRKRRSFHGRRGMRMGMDACPVVGHAAS